MSVAAGRTSEGRIADALERIADVAEWLKSLIETEFAKREAEDAEDRRQEG